MNDVVLSGRLTRDPEVYQGEKKVAKYSLAVDRRFGNETDFINCVTFERSAEFAEKYLKRGMKIIVRGRLETSSYTNKEGKKVNTTSVVIDEHEFCEPKSNGGFPEPGNAPEELPFD